MNDVIKIVVSQTSRSNEIGSIAMSIDGTKLAIINALTCEDSQPHNSINFHVVTTIEDIPTHNIAVHGDHYKCICTSDNILISMGALKMTEGLKKEIIKEFHRGVPLEEMFLKYNETEGLTLVTIAETCKEYCERLGISEYTLITSHKYFMEITSENEVEE